MMLPQIKYLFQSKYSYVKTEFKQKPSEILYLYLSGFRPLPQLRVSMLRSTGGRPELCSSWDESPNMDGMKAYKRTCDKQGLAMGDIIQVEISSSSPTVLSICEFFYNE